MLRGEVLLKEVIERRMEGKSLGARPRIGMLEELKNIWHAIGKKIKKWYADMKKRAEN